GHEGCWSRVGVCGLRLKTVVGSWHLAASEASNNDILFGREAEGGGEKSGKCCRDSFTCGRGVEDGGLRCGELQDGLAAGAAGHAGCAVEGDDSDRADAYGRAEEGDGSGDGSLFGARGEAVRGVLNIGTGTDLAGLARVRMQQNRRADAEMAVRRVGVASGFWGALGEGGDFSAGQRTRRHRA